MTIVYNNLEEPNVGHDTILNFRALSLKLAIQKAIKQYKEKGILKDGDELTVIDDHFVGGKLDLKINDDNNKVVFEFDEDEENEEEIDDIRRDLDDQAQRLTGRTFKV